MMKKPFVILFLTIPLLSNAQTQTYRIIGKIATPFSNARAYLEYHGLSRKSDSATITNGRFAFNGQCKQAASAYIMIRRLKGGQPDGSAGQLLNFYIEPGTISITSADSLKNATVTGGTVNADYNELKTILKATDKRRKSVESSAKAFTPEQLASQEIMASLNRRSDSIDREEHLLLAGFIKTHPHSVVSLDALYALGGVVPDYAEVEPLFYSLSGNIRGGKAGRNYAENLKKWKTISIGAPAPDFTMADTSGKMISLHDFKGKYVLIDFWASWCIPCRAENPNVVKAYKINKDKNFSILSVSADDDKARWIKAVHDDGLTWTHVSDLKGWENAAVQLYLIQGIPQNFLVDPDGKIIAKDLRGDALEDKLREIL